MAAQLSAIARGGEGLWFPKIIRVRPQQRAELGELTLPYLPQGPATETRSFPACWLVKWEFSTVPSGLSDATLVLCLNLK